MEYAISACLVFPQQMLVSIFIKFVNEKNLTGSGNAFGFLILAAVVFVVLVICLLIGVCRNILFHKWDELLGRWCEKNILKIAGKIAHGQNKHLSL